ncbi:AraC family transcriptional regulator [Chryseobacterium sp. 2987]|uniref:helix-turn-helix transcriptional regulator n=1 Tax=Chryseobacterium sp. 2987 TaxID=2817767 RepID=UPI002864B341|nr:AraC family transcriptional regulator [Chryseobacterium sp. 2987]MDR6923310.1 AraC-like DNA-binding protein [Chryseobacterium sp. 2987]
MKEFYHQRRIAVPEEFAGVFSHFYFVENPSSVLPVTKTLLPTYQTILLFCFGKSASMQIQEGDLITVDQCIIFGPVRQSFEYILPPGTSILAANFKDDAFFRFFGKIMTEKNRITHPDDLLEENCFTDLWHIISKIQSPEEQVQCILEFCKPYLPEQNATGFLLSSFENNALNPIKTIAGQTGQTERNIQRRQKEQFGYSQKEISRYNRFLKAIILIEACIKNQHQPEWFSIIEQCGYYDQSQLIHDFKHYLNLSPTQYLKFQQNICNPRSE